MLPGFTIRAGRFNISKDDFHLIYGMTFLTIILNPGNIAGKYLLFLYL